MLTQYAAGRAVRLAKKASLKRKKYVKKKYGEKPKRKPKQNKNTYQLKPKQRPTQREPRKNLHTRKRKPGSAKGKGRGKPFYAKVKKHKKYGEKRVKDV